jgi:hypothetical protein
VDFAHNRNEAIELAKGFEDVDYLYFIDADEEFQSKPGFSKDLVLDAYMVEYHYGELEYSRISLVSSKQSWKYEGVLHEYITTSEPHTSGQLSNCYVRVHPEGARSSDPLKFVKDAQTLRDALKKDPENVRYKFYLAQSLRDSGQLESALIAYTDRAGSGGWSEEVWYSTYQCAILMELLNRSSDYKYLDETIVATYLKAYEINPHRAETLGRLARFCRARNQFNSAYLFAKEGTLLKRSPTYLFLESSYYDWVCLDEAAISAYWCGRYTEARDLNFKLLRGSTLPESERPRVLKNMEFCLQKLRPEPRIQFSA